MVSPQIRSICDFISKGEEFKYIKAASLVYKADFMDLCNYTLDLYNYQRHNGLDIVGAKIMALNNMCDYAISVGKYRVNKHEKEK